VEVTPTASVKMKAPLYWQTSMGRLMGSSLLECSVNMSCVNIGDTNSDGFAHGDVNRYTANILDGFWMRSDQTMAFWNVAPSAPSTITGGSSSATLTVATCPAGFWPLIPNQILCLNGTSGGLVTTPYEAGAPGPGEFVRVTGGSCTPGATNGTITVVAATPGITTLYAHGAGYTLSNSERELILRTIDHDFQREVLDKLVRLETMMDTLIGGVQPGRMKIAEEKIAELERNDVRRSAYNRLVNAGISAAISAAIALHRYWLK
jgi:hypothetical protein